MAVRAGLQKNWKDSSGIILISGAYKYARSSTPISKLAGLGKNSLVVPLAETEGNQREWEVALVKRSSKTTFYANNYVFPGGRIDKADSSPEWLKLFHNSHVTDPFHPILALRDHSCSPRLPIYRELPDEPILGEIAFRICAVRELFEEAGVLLARGSDEMTEVIDCLPGTFPPAVKTLTHSEMNYWRDKVHADADEFINLCKELQCVPDIWSLLEWSDWLTPRNLPIRYDTLFYMCFIDTHPPVSPDGEEIVDAKWFTPSEALQLHKDSQILLTPPQFTELNYLQKLGPAPCLHSYALSELLNGSSLYRRMAVRILTKDKVLLVTLNSDDLYPENLESDPVTPHHPQSPTLSHIHLLPTQTLSHEYECPSHTAEELRTLSVKMSRMEVHGKGKFIYQDTVETEKVIRQLEQYGHYVSARGSKL